MSQYALTLLGEFSLTIGKNPPLVLPVNKAAALVAYIALEPNSQSHSQPRTRLASLFWPNMDDKNALKNLRNTLYGLRRLLQDTNDKRKPALFKATRQTIHLHEGTVIDAVRFQELVDDVSNHKHAHIVDCPHCERTLADAADLYRGELLAGLSLPDVPYFEEWLLLRREMLHQQALLVTSRLVEIYEAHGRMVNAHRYATDLLALDAYREESHRALMRILAMQGLPERALTQFEKLRQLLHEDLAVEPSPESLALVRQIASGSFKHERTGQALQEMAEQAPVSAVPHVDIVTTSPHPQSIGISAPDLSDVPEPGPFFGRMEEQQQLSHWLLHDRCRIIAILGMGGVGKTALATQWVRQVTNDAEQTPFDIILWRSLINAPPLAELLPPLLQMLSGQQLSHVPESVDEQIRLLLGYLCQQRILWVLDNMESILEPTHAGTFRPGYEHYEQLIRQVATLNHQSHLLLTSRERPRSYSRLERDSHLVQSMVLDGLDDAAGYQLLLQRGVRGNGPEEAMLIEHYSGNPLALKLVADTVDELFNGDIAEFLEDDMLIFDDIRTVLDQHFARLSDLEQQILFELAIAREPVTLSEIKSALLRVPLQRKFIEALRNLQRRSLIEHSESAFGLQNVITEYLTDQLVEAAIQEVSHGVFKLLHRHPLIKAQAKEYVRESQVRLILKPIGEQLIKTLSRRGAQQTIQQALTTLRSQKNPIGSYAAGNLLNLLLHHNFCVESTDFSHLYIRQAYLQGVSLPRVDFSHAEFSETAFTSNFGRVMALDISPGSRLLAVGTNNGNIRLYQLADGQLIYTLTGHSAKITSLAFSPDGRVLLSSGESSGMLYLWDVGKGERISSFHSEQGGVAVAIFSPDGTIIASGGHDGTIRLWDAASGQMVAILEQHADWVSTLAFHPSGKLLASGDLGQPHCYVWERQALEEAGAQNDAWTFRVVERLVGHKTPIRSTAFSPDGRFLAAGDEDATVVLWDVTQRREIATFHNGYNVVHCLKFGSDNAILFSSDNLTDISVWQLSTQQRLSRLRRHDRIIWDIALSGDGKTMVSGGSDGLVHVWDIRTPQKAQVVRTLQGSTQPIYTLQVNPRGDRFATGEDDGRIRIWQLATDSEQMRPTQILEGHTTLVDILAFSPDGTHLASGAHDDTVRLWNVADGECIATLATKPEDPHQVTSSVQGSHITFAPDGKMIAYAARGPVHIATVDACGDIQPFTTLWGHSLSIRALSFSPDGKYLASCSLDNSARLWDVATGACLNVFDQQVINFWSLVFSPDGSMLAGGGRTGIHIWELGTHAYKRISYSSMKKITNIRPVTFSADGRYLASGGIDRMVRIWDLTKDKELCCLAGHTADVTSISFLPGDEQLISGSYDGTIRLWSVQTGSCIQSAQIPGPYAGMKITGTSGISEAQRGALKALGALDVSTV